MKKKTLRDIRKAKGLTLDELARRAKSERSKLSRAERGYAKLREDELRRVARALGISVKQLAP